MGIFDIIIYAAIAAFLASRLWSVLGQREEDEQAPPRQNPFEPKEKKPEDEDEEPVMVLEGRARALTAGLTAAGHAPASLAGALDQIRNADPTFNEKKFLEGAKVAFNRIVEAFAAGDLSPVARFLGPAVREPFEKAIQQRKEANQTLENTIARLVAADIVAAQKKDQWATLTVEFVSHQVNLLKDAQGQLLDGTPGKAEEVRDVWVFQRDMTSANPNWQLIETRS